VNLDAEFIQCCFSLLFHVHSSSRENVSCLNRQVHHDTLLYLTFASLFWCIITAAALLLIHCYSWKVRSRPWRPPHRLWVCPFRHFSFSNSWTIFTKCSINSWTIFTKCSINRWTIFTKCSISSWTTFTKCRINIMLLMDTLMPYIFNLLQLLIAILLKRELVRRERH
jgi:hypothetical protein